MVGNWKFCLQLVMLLGKLVCNQSDAMQRCVLQHVLPNFTAEAGSPFYFSIRFNSTTKHMWQLKISLANGKDLPAWLEYRRLSGHLVGLALPEDFGTHHLRLHVTTQTCTADFFVHVQNATILSNSIRASGPCTDRDTDVWGNLLLQMNPACLNASRRIHLVKTIAENLHLQLNAIHLFTSNTSFLQRVRICSPSHQEKDFELDGRMGNFTQIVFHFGCKSQEQLLFLQDEFNSNFEMISFTNQLDVRLLSWKLLCAVEVAHKVKRDLKLDASHFLSQFASMSEAANTASKSQTFAQTSNIILSHFIQSSNTFSSDPAETAMRALSEHKAPSIPTLVHVTTESQGLPTSLTPGWDQAESHIWGDMYGYSHSESARPAPLKSPDQSNFSLDSSRPSAADVHQTEAFAVSPSLTTDSSLQSSHAILTHMFSPTPPLSQPSNTEQMNPKILQNVSEAQQEAISALNTIITDFTQATLVSKTPQETLESSRHDFTTGPTANTPALPGIFPSTYAHSPSFTAEEIAHSQGQTDTQLKSHMQPEIADSSGVCADQNGKAQCSSFSKNYKSTIDVFTSNFQADSSVFTEKPSFSQHLSNQVSFVSSHGTRLHAKLNTDTVSASANYPDHISPSGLSETVSSHFETMPSSPVQNPFTSSTTHSTERKNLDETLYPSMLLSSQLSAVTQNMLPTGETVLPQTHNLESSFLYVYSSQPSEPMYTLPFLSDYSSFGPSFTFEYIQPALTTRGTSLLEEFPSTAPHSGYEIVDSSNKCRGQYGQSSCFSVLFTAHLSNTYLASLQSTLEGLQSLHTTEKTHSVKRLSTSTLSDNPTMHLSGIESQYGVTSKVYIQPTPSLPSVIHSIDFSTSESIASASHFKDMAPSTVHGPYTSSTIDVFESLEPSFPLCNSGGLSRCTSTAGNIFPDYTYWTSHFKHSADWTSGVELSEQSFSVMWGNAETIDLIFSTSTPAQLQQIHESASYQMPTDSWGPSYMSSFSIMTFLPKGSSALEGHCEKEKGSLLNCQSSTPTTDGPTKQSTFFSVYNVIFTSSLPSVEQSSLNIIKPSSSVIATSSVNNPPEVLLTIPALTATVGFPFSYLIPENTFVDPEDGAADSLSIQMTLIDPPPPSVGSWLFLDGLELHGIPLELDTHFAPQHAILLSRDKGGLSISTKLTVDLQRNPFQPCHVFTLSAYLSFHSILLHRHKMELFITKISTYFNSIGHHHLAIVSVSPGSTVVSWYNYSLCENGRCSYNMINDMLLAMRFENKTVNPKFRDSMLPEFPLSDVGAVAYAKDCFPLTDTPTTTLKMTSEQQTTLNSSSSTAVTVVSEQVAQMADMFIALLVICSLILIVLFIAAILYFCQRTTGVVAIFPANHTLSEWSKDLRALRPRRAPLLHPEIPPPPLRLWIALNEANQNWQQQSDIDPQQLPSKYKFSNN